MNLNFYDEQTLKRDNIPFIKCLLLNDIKNERLNLKKTSLETYIKSNKVLNDFTLKYHLSSKDIKALEKNLLMDEKCLNIEYLPTEDWEFPKEIVIEVPSYDIMASAFSFIILVLPFGALFLSYFLINVFK
jgi:hypothetical protein